MLSISKRKLRPRDAGRFAKAEPWLFRELAEIICRTGVLPEKELHECWQMACLVHQNFPSVLRIADVAAGHSLLAWMLVLLARLDEVPVKRTAVALDVKRPKAVDVLGEAFVARWPELMDAVYFVEGSVDAVRTSLGADTLFVAVHACGSLSDRVLIAAMGSGASVAMMPCCHSLRKQSETLFLLSEKSSVSLNAIESNPKSIDQFRSRALMALGYGVREASIEPGITAFDRVILGQAPVSVSAKASDFSSERFEQIKRQGEVRAYEEVRHLDISDWDEVRRLSMRPSRAWERFFDLSFWVEDDSEVERLRDALLDLVSVPGCAASVGLRDQFLHPEAKRMSVMFRVELKSYTRPITREDVSAFRLSVCERLAGRFELRT